MSFDSLISEVHSLDRISKASLLLAVGFLVSMKDNVINLLIHSGVFQSHFLILQEMKLQNVFSNVPDKILHCSLQF